jgi:AcrR family transcriptional regulator
MAVKRRATFHHGDLRRALLDATLQLAAKRGAAGVTLREAARVAGVSQTAPYRHFVDKEAMLVAASEEGLELMRRWLADTVGEPSADPRRRIVEMLGAYVAFAVTHTAYFRLMFGLGSPPKAAGPTLQARARVVFQLLFGAVGECLARGVLRPADPRTTTFQLWALAHGIATLVIERQTQHLAILASDAAAIARASVEALLVGLGP